MSQITLLLNGNQYFGWTSAQVSASIDAAAREFTVTMAEVNLGALGEDFWAARRIAGAGVKVDATVQGFEYAGQIWEPNRLIFVNSAALKLDHEMLIESVTYIEDESGTRTDLKLVPPKASKSTAGTKSQRASESGEAAWEGVETERQPKPQIDLGPYGEWSWPTGAQ